MHDDDIHDNDKSTDDHDDAEHSSAKSGLSRRDLIRVGGLAAAAGVGGAIPMAAAADGNRHRCRTTLFPKYFPRRRFTPQIDIAGKFAVITGASRGIGRATAEELVARGVTVIGTSRDVGNVPNPPTSFDLLDLDVTSDASVNAFVSALLAHPDYPGEVDILINNAARFVIGTIIPPPIAPDPTGFFLDQTELGMETVYRGHVRVTKRLLPHMPQVGYSRLLFTVSSAAYGTGGTEEGEALGQSFFNVYYSGKRALLAYANNLRAFLEVSGSATKVSTVNPYAINTALAEGLNPVYTEPVDASGNAPFNPFLQAVLDGTRVLLQHGLPASWVGETYAQLLSMSEPVPNVVVGSRQEPFATMGATEVIEGVALAENRQSAVRFGCKHRPHDD